LSLVTGGSSRRHSHLRTRESGTGGRLFQSKRSVVTRSGCRRGHGGKSVAVGETDQGVGWRVVEWRRQPTSRVPVRSVSSREGPQVGTTRHHDRGPSGSARAAGHGPETRWWTCRTSRLHTKQRGADAVPVETKGYRVSRVQRGFVRLETIGWGPAGGISSDTLASRGVRFEWKRRSCRQSSKFSGGSRREWPEVDGCPPPLRFGWSGEKRGVGEGPV
jgi:hypothetical protein